MCELFAFSGERPALLRYSLAEFARHGAEGRNPDGWGIAHYVERDVRLVKETGTARDSGCLAFIQEHPLRSELVLSHVRRATQGANAIRNCQPFVRELGGAMHVFAHNGDLDRAGLARLARGNDFLPVGETDSEIAFCGLLERLRPLWRAAGGVPELAARRQAVAGYAEALRALGPANFLYADGDALFAHGHERIHPGQGIRPPGLHLLCRSGEAMATSGLRIEPAAADGNAALVASVALTDDAGWRALGEGELVVIRRGEMLATPPSQS